MQWFQIVHNFPLPVSALQRKKGRKEKLGLNNMKKTETSTEQNSLYKWLFIALSMRNQRGNKRVLDSSGSLYVSTRCDSIHFGFCALPGLPRY
jgi:hypothetical protein